MSEVMEKAKVSPAVESVEQWLAKHNQKDELKFLACGSVDDGKSTLIGRLLYESKQVYGDQLDALHADNQKFGHAENDIDFALLVDGLSSEREQGITIDIAWRYFSTDKRNFVVIDAPGHEQYTRNMATGASHCELAVILIDARHGVLEQTKRHAFICNLLGIKKFVVAINKMDIVDWSEDVYNRICHDFQTQVLDNLYAFKDQETYFVPLSALKGDNITQVSPNMLWYHGPSIFNILENIDLKAQKDENFRFRVQYVNRPNLNFRGFSGEIYSGSISVDDTITVLPSHTNSKIKEIITFDGSFESAEAGQNVTLCLEDEVDVSRGNVFSKVKSSSSLAHAFNSHIVWLHGDSLALNQEYLFKFDSCSTPGRIINIIHQINVNTFEKHDTETLPLNGIAQIDVELNSAIPCDPYNACKKMGAFLVIDPISHATLGMGMIRRILRRGHDQKSTNVVWVKTSITPQYRAGLKNQMPKVLWFTGLSGSGKSTIANLVEKKLALYNRHTFMLDGDNLRHGLNKNLGFSEEDRQENIRRTAEVTKLMFDAGLIVLVTLISPYRNDRNTARKLFQQGEFIEVFIDTPIEECARRDPKGLYEKVKAGEIKNFTGIDSVYEAPTNPDIHICTVEQDPEAAAGMIIEKLLKL